jgi:hypothetical protein
MNPLTYLDLPVLRNPRPGLTRRRQNALRPLLEWLEDRATPTTVTGTAGDDLLVVYLTPGGGPADMTYVLNNNAPVNLSGEKSFTFNGGDGNDTVILSGTAAGCAVTLNGEGGDDSFFLGTCATGNVTTIGGPLTVNGGAGANLLSVLDGARTTDTRVDLYPGPYIHVGGVTIGSDSSFTRGLLLTTGSGNDAVGVNWAWPSADTRIYTQGGDDSFVVNWRFLPYYDTIGGPVLVDGGTGANRVTFNAGAVPPDWAVSGPKALARTLSLTQDTCRIDTLPVVYTATGGSFAGGVYVVSNVGDDQITVFSARRDGPTFIYGGHGDDTITVHVGAGSAYNLIVNASASTADGATDAHPAGNPGGNGSLTVIDDTGGAVIGRATSSATAGVVQLLYGDSDVSTISYLNVDEGVFLPGAG